MRSVFKVIFILSISSILPTFSQDMADNVTIFNDLYDKFDSKSSKKIVQKFEKTLY